MWLAGRHEEDCAGVEVFKGAITIVLAMEVANNRFPMPYVCHSGDRESSAQGNAPPR